MNRIQQLIDESPKNHSQDPISRGEMFEGMGQVEGPQPEVIVPAVKDPDAAKALLAARTASPVQRVQFLSRRQVLLRIASVIGAGLASVVTARAINALPLEDEEDNDEPLHKVRVLDEDEVRLDAADVPNQFPAAPSLRVAAETLPDLTQKGEIWLWKRTPITFVANTDRKLHAWVYEKGAWREITELLGAFEDLKQWDSGTCPGRVQYTPGRLEYKMEFFLPNSGVNNEPRTV